MKLVSPIELEVRIRRVESKIVTFLGEKSNFFLVWVGAALLCLLVAYVNSILGPRHFYDSTAGFNLIRHFRYGIFVVILLSPISIILKDQFQPAFHILSLLLAWFYVTQHLLHVPDPTLRVLIQISIPAVCLLGWVYLRFLSSHELKIHAAVVYSILFWALSLEICLKLGQLGSTSKLYIFWRFQMHYVWLMVLYTGLTQKLTWRECMMAICPVNSLRGVLWPVESQLIPHDYEVKKRLWWRGFLYVLWGYSMIITRIFSEDLFFKGLKPDQAMFLQPRSLILTFLAMMGWLNIMTGLARMFGYQIIDATNFALLARRPLEYWKRGSTYQYLFNVRFVFIPVLKRIKVSIVALTAAFLAYIINKMGMINIFFFVKGLVGIKSLALPERRIFFKEEIYFLAFVYFFLILAISRKIWFFNNRQLGNPKLAWASILCNHAVMGSVVYFWYVIYSVINHRPVTW